MIDGSVSRAKVPPSLKSRLIDLNLVMDRIVEVAEYREFSEPTSLHSLEQLCPFEEMVLQLEDRRYFRHAGVDYRCLPRIARQLMTFKKVGGVSTIEQQFVRTILERNERTLRRKGREMLLAWVLTYRVSKVAVLRAYLAIVYLGYRVRGCDEAARLVFGKDASDLTADAAAFVASLMVYPLPRAVRTHFEQAFFPVADVAAFLKDAAPVAPRWSSRIERRMNYALALSRKSKKAT